MLGGNSQEQEPWLYCSQSIQHPALRPAGPFPQGWQCHIPLYSLEQGLQFCLAPSITVSLLRGKDPPYPTCSCFLWYCHYKCSGKLTAGKTSPGKHWALGPASL